MTVMKMGTTMEIGEVPETIDIETDITVPGIITTLIIMAITTTFTTVTEILIETIDGIDLMYM